MFYAARKMWCNLMENISVLTIFIGKTEVVQTWHAGWSVSRYPLDLSDTSHLGKSPQKGEAKLGLSKTFSVFIQADQSDLLHLVWLPC